MPDKIEVEERLLNDGFETEDVRNIPNLLTSSWQVADLHRFLFCSKLINSIPKKKVSVLDVGCSSGRLLQVQQKLARTQSTKSLKYVGNDARESCLDKLTEFAKNNMSDSAEVYREQGNIIFKDFCKKLIKTYGKFDVISILEVFEHIPIEYNRLVLSNLYHMLDDDGVIVLSTPVHFKDEEMYWPEDHFYEYKFDELKDLLSERFDIIHDCGNHVKSNELKQKLKGNEIENSLYKKVLKYSKNGAWLNELFGCYFYECCKGHIFVLKKKRS